jgi:hypothetical protein
MKLMIGTGEARSFAHARMKVPFQGCETDAVEML